MQMSKPKKFTSFKEFYPYYLLEHSNPQCRFLHYVGTALVIILVAAAIITKNWNLLWFVPLAGYGFAWAGHFIFEKNKPATFKHPFYSLASDFVMFWHMITRRLTINMFRAKTKYPAS